MPNEKTELVQLQGEPSEIQPDIARTETNLVLAPVSLFDRLRHFPDEVYDLSAESKLVKFIKVLLGDAGAGQLRKHLLIQRLQSTLQGSHFYNLDRFYGPLFGLTRSADELLGFDPYTETATRDQWAVAHAKDASFRSRIEQFARALLYGPTPTGIELIAEALLSVDVDVYESWIQADKSYQTYQELENQFASIVTSDNVISVETDVSDWYVDTNVTLAQSTTWAFPDGFTPGGGTDSLEMTSVAAGDIIAAYSYIPGGSIAGIDYTFAAVFNVSVDRNVRVDITWYDTFFSVISTSTGTPVAATAGLPVQASVSATAPGSAEVAEIKVIVESTAAASEVHEVDRMELSTLNYSNMEGESYSDLEGLGLGRLSGDERRIFTIRPKRPITLSESYDLKRVLHKIKPADTRFIIEAEGVDLYDPVEVNGAYSDSEYWEIIPKITSLGSFTNEPYQVVSDEPEEQPVPPFSGYQGEAWSYITDLAGVVAFTQVDNQETGDTIQTTMPVSRVVYDNGDIGTFQPEQAMLPSRMVYAGRVVSDAIAVAWPFLNTRTNREDIETDREETPLYVDSIPIKNFLETLSEIPDVDPFQQNLANRYFVTPSREQDDTTEEALELRLNRDSWVNYITFEAAKYPHDAIVETYDSDNAVWEEQLRWEYGSSSPRVLSPGRATSLREGHPEHNFEGHFERIRYNFEEAKYTSRVRIRMRRTPGEAPLASQRPEAPTVPYSLAIRGLDIGYRVRTREDFNFLNTDEIGSTKDGFGSQLTFEVKDQFASNVLNGDDEFWKSNPQPVNYSVVNLYLDTRENGDGRVIDRFFLNPIYDGAHLSIYYSMDPQEIEDFDDPEESVPGEGGSPGGGSLGGGSPGDSLGPIEEPTEEPPEQQESEDVIPFMEERTWTPIPRDFTVQKGNLYIPPTRARYWKFEFTSLNTEVFENFLPIEREVKLFPRWVVDKIIESSGHADEALLPGMRTFIDVADTVEYGDAIGVLQQTSVNTEEFKPTEARYITDLNVAQNMKDKTWVYRFTPWHQDQSAPRFDTVSQHVYETAKVRHTSKVAFFAGLKELKAYRSNWEANDDPSVYFDTYDDFRNLEEGFDWAFNPGYLTTEGTSPPVSVESRTFLSKSPVKAIQFATEQSSPVQLVPDPEFRNPALASYDWTNTDSYTKVGDATLVYNASDFSVRVIRYLDPPTLPTDVTDGMVQPIPHPVFSWRPFSIADETYGGIRSPLLGLSDEGRAHAAVRFTMLTTQTYPLKLQVINDITEGIIAEKTIEARQNQQVEEYISFEIDAPDLTTRIQLIQEGDSNDQFKVFSMAMFDDGMVWEWSVNGGGDWYDAKEIRNNDNGILTFPEPGNQLKYRIRAFRTGRWVSAIKIRPHYLGVGNARGEGTHRGTNVSFYDQDVPIHEDPMFTTWKRPVPFWWFAASRRFPLLAIEGATTDSEFNAFYGRPFDEILDAVSIALARDIYRVRTWEEELNFTFNDEVARTVTAPRAIGETVPAPSISIAWSYVSGLEGGLIHPQIDPVFSEYGPYEEAEDLLDGASGWWSAEFYDEGDSP